MWGTVCEAEKQTVNNTKTEREERYLEIFCEGDGVDGAMFGMRVRVKA